MGWRFLPRLVSVVLFITAGAAAFRSIGLIIAAVANSFQESNILVQLCYLPMLLLSGATFPTSIMPEWLQITAQFIPATHLVTGLQGIMMRNESLAANWVALGALGVTLAVALFVASKLFRWEKEEKIKGVAKLWVLGVLLPFFLLGSYQAYSRENLGKNKILARELSRSRTLLIRNTRIVIGDGKVIESGGVLVRKGKIAEIYDGAVPEADAVNADGIEAAGKTLLPGLIDAHVHLIADGSMPVPKPDFDPEKAMLRNLASQLYSGVTAVRSAGDSERMALKVRKLIRSGEKLGAEPFISGPLFTAPGGHGTEYFRQMPEAIRKTAEQEFARTPRTPEEARRQVAELSAAGVDSIKAVLDAGAGAMPFPRLEKGILSAIGAEARAHKLPLLVHTGDSRDVADAVEAGAASVEHGSFRDEVPATVWSAMASRQVAYDPTLAAAEGVASAAAGGEAALGRSLAQQVMKREVLETTRKALTSPEAQKRFAAFPIRADTGARNLMAAWKAGVPLVTGSDAGNPLDFHGPGLHREMQLWVAAGVPPGAVLRAATGSAAALLGAGGRIGMIRKGYDADLLLVDGNPLADISATERVSAVIFKGERVARSQLFEEK